jgi:glycerophosphoryl diester phosphodiesterase
VKDKVRAINVVTRKFVENAHRRNLQVHAWTVNDLDGMRRMVAASVDGIITDYTGPLLALLGRVAVA